MGLVAKVRCVACAQMGVNSPSEVHHMRFGDMGKRKSDYLSIALCPDHHRGTHSIHQNRRQFERQFGDEDTLHALTLEGIDRVIKSRIGDR